VYRVAMALKIPDDILLPMTAPSVAPRPHQSRIVAFVPIVIALMGVTAILLGRVTAQDLSKVHGALGVDPIQTGAIATPPISGYGVDAIAR
jgi:hypothetical protein